MTGKKGWSKIWNIPAPKALDEAVKEAVMKGTHVSKSEFVRDACRKLLESLYYESTQN